MAGLTAAQPALRQGRGKPARLRRLRYAWRMFMLGASGQIQVAKARRAGLFAMTLFDVEVELHCPELEPSSGGSSAVGRSVVAGSVVAGSARERDLHFETAVGELDAAWLRQRLQDVIEPLHQQALDEHPAFAPRGMSPARLARYVCGLLLQVCRKTLGSPAAGYVRVVVRESPSIAWAGYTGPLRE